MARRRPPSIEYIDGTQVRSVDPDFSPKGSHRAGVMRKCKYVICPKCGNRSFKYVSWYACFYCSICMYKKG